jgi:hypothetical protein
VPSQHKHSPISFRPAEEDRAWLLRYSEATGIPVNRILTDAVTAFRADLVWNATKNSDTVPLAKAIDRTGIACRSCVDIDAGLVCQADMGGQCPNNAGSLTKCQEGQ